MSTVERMGTRLSEEQARTYVLGPESVSWRKSSDIRGFFGAGYALLMQTAHPTVGAGVRDHSNYQNEPWQRLYRTLDYVNLTVYGGEDAIEVTQRVRAMHKRIRGTHADGSKYHALEPGAYAWVQATLIKAIIDVNQRFVGSMTPEEHAQLYQEWRGLARLLGVREGDLPADYADFDAYVDGVIESQLELTESAGDVLASFRKTEQPPFLPRWTAPLWRLAFWPAGRVLLLVTTGLLPPVLRERLGLKWSPGRERLFRLIGWFSRSLSPVLPRFLKVTGPDYLRQRRRYLARDEFAPARYRAEFTGQPT